MLLKLLGMNRVNSKGKPSDEDAIQYDHLSEVAE